MSRLIPELADCPTLPLELERRVFELAAVDDPKCASILMLVAVRVHFWIASTRYSICNQLGVTYPPTKSHNPALDYYGQFVKHLIIGGDRSGSDIIRYLSSYPSLIDLALWSDLDIKLFMPALTELKIQRLSANLSTLSLMDFRRKEFANISHLDVTRLGNTWTKWKGLTFLPCLSHIAVNQEMEDGTFNQLLLRCTRLRILLVVISPESVGGWNGIEALSADSRFVVMQMWRYVIYDWMDGALGRRDMWGLAEEISVAKSCGLIKDVNYIGSCENQDGWKAD